jgi:hypothetical protein
VNLEHGFRRITLVVSLAALIAGLAVTIYAIRLTVISVSLVKAHDFEAVPCDPEITAKGVLFCFNTDIPKPFGRFIAPRFGEEVFWYNWLDSSLSLFFRMTSDSYSLVLFPLIEGVVGTTFISLVPWSVFYLVRWIAHGFKE